MESLDKRTNELIKKAFSLWGIDDISSRELDPLVKLLLAATAGESLRIEKIINDLVYKVIDVFTDNIVPESLCGPRPAFGMIYGKPVDPVLNIQKHLSFEISKVLPNSNDAVNLSFVPAVPFKLFDAQIRAVFAFSKLICFPAETEYSPRINDPSGNTIWLGIEANYNINDLNGLSIYFDLPSELATTQNTQSQIIDDIKLFVDDQQIEIEKVLSSDWLYANYYYQGKYQTPYMISYLDLILDAAASVSDRYFVISDKKGLDKSYKRQNYPDAFKKMFDNDTLSELDNELFWLELRFPGKPAPIFNNLKIHINTFPVINLETVPVSLSSEEPVKKIDLMPHQGFSGVIDYLLFDEYHNQINPSMISNPPFIIRKTETERYSPYDLLSLLDELFYRYSSDKQAFGDLYSLNSEDIRTLNQILIKLKEGYEKHKMEQLNENVYAILSPKEHVIYDRIEVTCAVTAGAHANQVSAGEQIQTNSPMIVPDSLVFISRTMNGRNSISGVEKRRDARYYFTTHDKIISHEDIVAFSYKELGDGIQKIKITKGTTDSGHSLQKAIVVDIKLNNQLFKMEDLLFLQKRLEYKLNIKSALVLPVRFVLSL